MDLITESFGGPRATPLHGVTTEGAVLIVGEPSGPNPPNRSRGTVALFGLLTAIVWAFVLAAELTRAAPWR